MPTPSGPQRLPAKPSQEHLRKLAKRLAKSRKLQLAAAQSQLAADYGYPDWAALMRAVDDASRLPTHHLTPLTAAAARADAATVRDLLARGAAADGVSGEINTPLWTVCNSDAPAERRLTVARLLLEAGASTRRSGADKATALHAAARRGPLALVELLIRHGALLWLGDRRNKTALDYARKGTAADRDRIVELLDRPVIRDKHFREAVQAIHGGEVATLCKLLDRHPGLLHERAIEPDCFPRDCFPRDYFPRDYFRDPKLFWFIANNPTLMRTMPANIVEVGRAMIARRVEQSDLDYTLELVMSNGHSRKRERQDELIALLLGAGANPTPQAVMVALAHRGFDAVKSLMDRGVAMSAPMAAALGRNKELSSLLPHVTPEDRQNAFGMAVVNMRTDAARLCLDAGADPNAFLPVHRHSTPLHQAAVNDDLDMLKLLVARGAKLDARDTLWNDTPLGWSIYTEKRNAEAYLRLLAHKPAGQ